MRSFTLIELFVVIVIIGILVLFVMPTYARLIERSRAAEAKAILGRIRTVQEAYKPQHGSYSSSLDDLTVEAPFDCSGNTHYFWYSVDGTNIGTATRCIRGTGKYPGYEFPYEITINYGTGEWGGTAGYY